MKSILAAAAAILAAAAIMAIATPGDAATPRTDFASLSATADAGTPVEYIAFEPMEITASPAIVMEPLVIVVDAPESETLVMAPMHIVGHVDTTPVPAL